MLQPLLLQGPGLPVEHCPGHDEDGPGQHGPGGAVTIGMLTSITNPEDNITNYLMTMRPQKATVDLVVPAATT